MGHRSIFAQILIFSTIATAAPLNKISSSIDLQLAQASHVDILVSLHNSSTTTVLQHLSQQRFQNRADRLKSVTTALRQFAEDSQREILQAIAPHLPSNATIKSLWVSNQIFIKGADFNLINFLDSLEQVSSIELDEHIKMDEPINSHGAPRTPAEPIAWGVKNIRAPRAWTLVEDEDTTAGRGVIIGSVDSGVRWTHEALRENYIGGPYGWFDPYFNSAEPNDDRGHGTHTLGSIVGKYGIGVAPNARWMACRGCADGSCALSALLQCGEFMLCPTPDCSQAPHVVSNSWGTIRGSLFYNPTIEAYHAAGIVPVFAIGNNGNECSTALAPGDQHTIGVGATTKTGELATYSSHGPSYYGDVKPNLVAPGSDILSAYHTSDDAYQVLSGTSMATPHVAGVVALLMAVRPELEYDYVLLYLYHGADQLTATGKTCGYVEDYEIPNNSFGYGKVNAFKSLRELLRDQDDVGHT